MQLKKNLFQEIWLSAGEKTVGGVWVYTPTHQVTDQWSGRGIAVKIREKNLFLNTIGKNYMIEKQKAVKYRKFVALALAFSERLQSNRDRNPAVLGSRGGLMLLLCLSLQVTLDFAVDLVAL